MYLAEPHAMRALNDRAHALEGPKLGAKTVLGWTLQQRFAQSGQLLPIELRRAPTLGNFSKRVNAAFIEQPLACVNGLPRHIHRKRHFGATLARQQHPARFHPFLCCFAQSNSRHDSSLQCHHQRHNAWPNYWLS
jgi:hypothetical protein